MKIDVSISKIPDLKIIMPDKSFYLRTAIDTSKTIVKRTQSGIDVNGKPFKPYSRAYAEFRRRNKRDVVPVNLTFSADMLNSIRSESSDKYGRVYLTGTEGVKAFGNQKRGRQFFDVSKEEFSSIVKTLESYMTTKNGLK